MTESTFTVFKPYIKAAEEIQQQAEEINRYRAIERASRSRWQGGGFGIGGAIKGALTAGAMNAVTGAFRGIGDSITDAGDAESIAKIKRQIMSDSSNLDTLAEELFERCITVFYGVCDILIGEDIIPVIANNTDKQDARLNNYISLYENDRCTDEQLIDVIINNIQYFPFNIEYYTTLYNLADENKSDIKEIADFFGMVEYKSIINEIDLSNLEEILDLSEDTEEGIDYKIALLEKLHQDNSAIKVDGYIAKLNGNKVKLKEKLLQLEKERQNEEEHAKDMYNIRVECVNKRKIIDDAFKNNNVTFVWNEVEKGNTYAEYVLNSYYLNVVFKDCIENYELNEMNRLLKGIIELEKQGYLFARYLHMRVEFEMYSYSKYGMRNEKSAKKIQESIIQLADLGCATANFDSAMFILFPTQFPTPNRTKYYTSDGIKYMETAAKLLHPNALFMMGTFYRTGNFNLNRDEEKSELYLTMAAGFGFKSAEEELEKLCDGDDDSSSSSDESCFITTAVCKSFGKPDDCYELMSFRKFRDNWLRSQLDGDEIIENYYKIAPQVVAEIDKKANSGEIYRHIWSEYLSPCLAFIEAGNNEACKEAYMAMVYSLSKQYCCR